MLPEDGKGHLAKIGEDMRTIENKLYISALERGLSNLDLSPLQGKTVLITGATGMLGSCVVDEGTGGIRLLGKLREIKSVEEKIYQIVSDFCSGDMIENLKIVRDFNRIHLDFNMLDQILSEINRTYGVNLKKEAIINQEYGNINYLSRYIYQNKLRGEESDTV